MNTLPVKFCRVCGVELDRHDAIRGICKLAECRRLDVPYQLARREQSLHSRIRKVAAQLWLEDEDRGTAYVPANSSKLEPLPKQRQVAIRAHISQIIRQALSDSENNVARPDEKLSPRHGLSENYDRLPLLDALCGLCQGYCCHLGGDTAFLTTAVIRRVMHARPNSTSSEIEADYVACIPDIHYSGSCVYHTEQGCALPRDLRSGVCNHYICEDLAKTIRQWEALDHHCVVASAEGMRVERIAKMTESGIDSILNVTHEA